MTEAQIKEVFERLTRIETKLGNGLIDEVKIMKTTVAALQVKWVKEMGEIKTKVATINGWRKHMPIAIILSAAIITDKTSLIPKIAGWFGFPL